MTGSLRRYLRTFTGFERDARILLAVTVVYGVWMSLYWVDFNLYLTALGHPGSFIGLVGGASSAAGALAAFPASFLSDRLGRRLVLMTGTVLSAVASGGLLLASAPLALVALASLSGVATQAFGVVLAPFLTEHSRPEQRSELFSLQSALGSGTNVVAVLVGGWLASVVAGIGGFSEADPAAYRVLLMAMTAAAIGATAILVLVRDDRPRRRRRDWRSLEQRAAGFADGEPLSHRPDLVPRRVRSIGRLPRPADPQIFWRLLVPGFLISLGAGQVIPYLNVYVKGRFGLDLSSINAIFAVTSLGTAVAMLVQPALAKRFGKVSSVALVQAVSIPFLIVLGFSPVLWTVVIAMAVRNSLMNAGNPISTAFAMEILRPGSRATYAAAANLLWSLGWVIGGWWYGFLQGSLGFDGGYTVNFVSIIALYSVATALYYGWFHRREVALVGALR